MLTHGEIPKELNVTGTALNLIDINSVGCSLQLLRGTEHHVLVSYYSLESGQRLKTESLSLLQFTNQM